MSRHSFARSLPRSGPRARRGAGRRGPGEQKAKTRTSPSRRRLRPGRRRSRRGQLNSTIAVGNKFKGLKIRDVNVTVQTTGLDPVPPDRAFRLTSPWGVSQLHGAQRSRVAQFACSTMTSRVGASIIGGPEPPASLLQPALQRQRAAGFQRPGQAAGADGQRARQGNRTLSIFDTIAGDDASVLQTAWPDREDRPAVCDGAMTDMSKKTTASLPSCSSWSAFARSSALWRARRAPRRPRRSHHGHADFAIPDATGGVFGYAELTIEVGKKSKGLKIRDVNVTVQTTGSTAVAAAGLIAVLIAPDGGTNVLFFQLATQNLGPLTLDDESRLNLASGPPPAQANRYALFARTRAASPSRGRSSDNRSPNSTTARSGAPGPCAITDQARGAPTPPTAAGVLRSRPASLI